MTALDNTFAEVGDGVTAGQVALRAGVSRNTAKKWLDSLCKDDKVRKEHGVHVNGQDKVVYAPYAPCPVCGARERDESGWTEERGYGALYRHYEVLCRNCGEYLDGGVIDLQD